MRVSVLGAAGSVGRLVVEEALTRHHKVTAPARRPETMGALHASVVQGARERAERTGEADE
jgi:uncharacterized protein YbjT (DUF2867 family)